MSRRRVGSLGAYDSRPPSTFIPTSSTHSHVSTYRSSHLEVQVYSPSVTQQGRRGSWGPLPVFSDHDTVSGRVILTPDCAPSGRLTMSIEGAFHYPSSTSEADNDRDLPMITEMRKHVFFSSSNTVAVFPTVEPSTSRSAFRDAFTPIARRRPSVSSLNSGPSSPVERSYPFSFELAQGNGITEELPSTHTPETKTDLPVPCTQFDGFEVTYKILVAWESSTSLEIPPILEVPILVHPDPDFQSLDAQTVEPSSWLEMPLRSDRPIPFRCAVTLPTSVTFSRSSSIPYFVVFTTTPRSSSLAKEIAADATISVSLHRQVTVTVPASLPPTPPLTPPASTDEFEPPKGKLLRRVVKGAQPRLLRTRPFEELAELRENPDEKPLPSLPTQTAYSESRTLMNGISIGFPKRPRHRCDPASHPSLDTHASLPDGLQKDKLALNTDMLPCIDRGGVSVKYYLDVSVLIGQDDLRARIPIRIL